MEDNLVDGIIVNPTASFTFAGPQSTLSVLNNGARGISLQGNSSAVLRNATLAIQGNGGGSVVCNGSVGLVLRDIASAQLDSPPSNCN